MAPRKVKKFRRVRAGQAIQALVPLQFGAIVSCTILLFAFWSGPSDRVGHFRPAPAPFVLKLCTGRLLKKLPNRN